MIPYRVDKLALNPTYSTRGLVKYVPGRDYFRAAPSQNGDKCVTSPPPLNRLTGRQAIIWHPTADAGEVVSSDTATKGGGGARHRHYSPRPKKTSHYTSSLASREAVSKGSESEQHEPEGAGESEGAFELERGEDETGGIFAPEGATSDDLEPEKPLLLEPQSYGRKRSAPNSPLRDSSNIRPTHACSGAYCAGKS